jgi:hypothetical protein
MEVSGQLHAPASLPQGKEPPLPIGYEAEWNPQRREKPYPRIPAVQYVVIPTALSRLWHIVYVYMKVEAG